MMGTNSPGNAVQSPDCLEQYAAVFHQVFNFDQFGFQRYVIIVIMQRYWTSTNNLLHSHEQLKLDPKKMFANKIHTDGFSVSFVFSRKANPHDQNVVGTDRFYTGRSHWIIQSMLCTCACTWSVPVLWSRRWQAKILQKYKNKQTAISEAVNILANGGKKYRKKKDGNTKRTRRRKRKKKEHLNDFKR